MWQVWKVWKAGKVSDVIWRELEKRTSEMGGMTAAVGEGSSAVRSVYDYLSLQS